MVILCGPQYVTDACHKTLIRLMPVSSRIPVPRQHIPGITQGIGFLGYPTPSRLAAWSPAPAQGRESRDGFPRSECPFDVTLELVLSLRRNDALRRCPFEWLPHTDVLYGLDTVPFGSCLSAIWQVLHDDASTAPSLTVIHSHLLSGVTALARSLPPFLPASDPRLPDARQGKALSLHHLEGRGFTYMDTQLSRYNDLAAHPPIFKDRFRANGSHPPPAADHLRCGYARALRQHRLWFLEGVLPELAATEAEC